jgi:hypothetical protein
MATFKIDGLFFVLGGLTGIFLFGETVGLYEDWWNGSYFGRLTIMDWLNLPTGVVVVAVVLMALFMFWGGEQLERIFGKRDLAREPRLRVAGAVALVLAAVAVLLVGAPDTADKWARVSDEKERLVAAREVQIHPGELLASLADDRLKVRMLDVRSESDFNMFHIQGSQHVELSGLLPLTKEFLASSTKNTVYVVMSNDELAATDAWRVLAAESVPNVYILEGGINQWLSTFSAGEPGIVRTAIPAAADQLRFDFPAALGSRYGGASPNPHEWELEYTPKIKLQIKRDKSGGGCG